MSDTTTVQPSARWRISVVSALITAFVVIMMPEVVDFAKTRIWQHQYDIKAKILNELPFSDEFFDGRDGLMVRIYAPGPLVSEWKDAAMGYWIQKYIDGKTPIFNCLQVGQGMVLECEVHRVVRR